MRNCCCTSHNGFLTRRGYEGVDKQEQKSYLDNQGSVSALVEGEVSLLLRKKQINSALADPSQLEMSSPSNPP